LEFHEVKQKQMEALKSGELKVSEELLSRKKDKDAFDKKGNAPVVFMKRYRDANRSLDPYASVGSGP